MFFGCPEKQRSKQRPPILREAASEQSPRTAGASQSDVPGDGKVKRDLLNLIAEVFGVGETAPRFGLFLPVFTGLAFGDMPWHDLR